MENYKSFLKFKGVILFEIENIKRRREMIIKGRKKEMPILDFISSLNRLVLNKTKIIRVIKPIPK